MTVVVLIEAISGMLQKDKNYAKMVGPNLACTVNSDSSRRMFVDR